MRVPGAGLTARASSTATPCSARSSPTSSAKVCRVRGSPSMSSVTALSSATNAVVPPARNATTRACGTRRRSCSGRTGTRRRRAPRRAPDRRAGAGTVSAVTVGACAMRAAPPVAVTVRPVGTSTTVGVCRFHAASVSSSCGGTADGPGTTTVCGGTGDAPGTTTACGDTGDGPGTTTVAGPRVPAAALRPLPLPRAAR